MSDLTINISKLSEGTHQRTFDVEAREVGLDSRFTERLGVEATLDKTGRQLRLRATIRAKGQFSCDRCLDEFEKTVTAQYSIVYVIEEGGQKAQAGEEVQYLSADANVLDLGEDVRQYLILAVPQKLLCSDECKGLCPKCGVNRNKVRCDCATNDIDPRWEGLRKMSFN